MAKVKLTLEDHTKFIVDLGRHSWDKMVDMGKAADAEYPSDYPRQISVGLWAADYLFSGKHAIPDVTEAVNAVRHALNDGRLPTWH